MKKEKELKEASRVKDHRSVDIFALAGVNLPKPKSSLPTGTPTLAPSRQDSVYSNNNTNNSRHGPPGKKPRLQKTSSSTITPLSPPSNNSVTSPRRENEETANGTNASGRCGAAVSGVGTGTASRTGMEKKLKRSSMAVRNAAVASASGAASQMHVHGSSTGDSSGKMAATATPPTPIPSPGNELTVQMDTSNSTNGRSGANGRRWSGSTDSREETVQTARGQSLRAVRHQSPDTIADYHPNA
ncbi:hypothetical protein BG015_004281, partial [Linnemannia schmuckeri]